MPELEHETFVRTARTLIAVGTIYNYEHGAPRAHYVTFLAVIQSGGGAPGLGPKSTATSWHVGVQGTISHSSTSYLSYETP